jgi:hypothetical protein
MGRDVITLTKEMADPADEMIISGCVDVWVV